MTGLRGTAFRDPKGPRFKARKDRPYRALRAIAFRGRKATVFKVPRVTKAKNPPSPDLKAIKELPFKAPRGRASKALREPRCRGRKEIKDRRRRFPAPKETTAAKVLKEIQYKAPKGRNLLSPDPKVTKANPARQRYLLNGQRKLSLRLLLSRLQTERRSRLSPR
jgi:hypothetical protein